MKAFEIDPDDPEAHRIMGAIKLVSEDYEQALYHHERARELCPSDAYIIARYATLLIYLGQPDRALEEISRAKRIDPFCPDILKNLRSQHAIAFFIMQPPCQIWERQTGHKMC